MLQKKRIASVSDFVPPNFLCFYLFFQILWKKEKEE